MALLGPLLPNLHMLPVHHGADAAHLAHSSRIDAACAAHFGRLVVDVGLRAARRDGVLVAVDEDVVVLAEEAVDVLERARGRLRVEEVDDGQEGEVEDGPDDVEAPAQGLDADGRDLDDCESRSAGFGLETGILWRERAYP